MAVVEPARYCNVAVRRVAGIASNKALSRYIAICDRRRRIRCDWAEVQCSGTSHAGAALLQLCCGPQVRSITHGHARPQLEGSGDRSRRHGGAMNGGSAQDGLDVWFLTSSCASARPALVRARTGEKTQHLTTVSSELRRAQHACEPCPRHPGPSVHARLSISTRADCCICANALFSRRERAWCNCDFPFPLPSSGPSAGRSPPHLHPDPLSTRPRAETYAAALFRPPITGALHSALHVLRCSPPCPLICPRDASLFWNVAARLLLTSATLFSCRSP